MSDRLSPKSSFVQLRFLLIQYQIVSVILEKYPNNFAFEISSRLVHFSDVLPELIYNLLCQCQCNCALRMIKNEMQSSDWCLMKHVIGFVHTINQSIFCLFILLQGKFIIIRTSAGNWSDEETGITIYCVLENGELRQYNVTIMTYLPYERINQSENSLLKEPIDSLQIHDKFVVTLDTRKW
ncbi:unnamed protein product [Rotaria sordida]|uniref:Uncharacterized protein n=1 Tax=Rotaria sordida TaxID=392033 RepID=A0A815KJM6_9BILA|nr:unnamed protein product [Rotaria sordida]